MIGVIIYIVFLGMALMFNYACHKNDNYFGEDD